MSVFSVIISSKYYTLEDSTMMLVYFYMIA